MGFSWLVYVLMIDWCGSFILLAYFSNLQNDKIEVIIYIALALLFQPFFKIALGKTIWNIVDVIVGVSLIASIFIKPKHL